MFHRHKSSLIAALLALLVCVGAVALLDGAPKTVASAGPGIASEYVAPAPGSAQLLRTGHSQHSRVFSRTSFAILPHPLLVPRPGRESEFALAVCPARSSALPGVHAGRSPPCFS